MKPLTGSTTDQAPADPAATDDVLATQPIGYWSGLAHTAVTRQLRDAMARIDVTQPQYWVLNRVHGGPAAPGREEVVTQLTPSRTGRTRSRGSSTSCFTGAGFGSTPDSACVSPTPGRLPGSGCVSW